MPSPPSNVIYTPAQRETVFRLREQGKTGAQIAEACRRGVDGLDPFDIPPSSALSIARTMKAAQLARDVPADAHVAAVGLLRRLVALARIEVDQLERSQRSGRRVDLARLRAAADIVAKLETAARKAPPDPSAPKPRAGDADASEGRSFLASLEEEEGRIGTSRHPSRAPIGAQDLGDPQPVPRPHETGNAGEEGEGREPAGAGGQAAGQGMTQGGGGGGSLTTQRMDERGAVTSSPSEDAAETPATEPNPPPTPSA